MTLLHPIRTRIFRLCMIVLVINLCSVRGQNLVHSVTFNISKVDRIAGKSGVEATFTFSQPVLIGSVTLNYPLNFFARSPTPTAIVSNPQLQLVPQQPQNTFMILENAGPLIPALPGVVTVTLVGCTLGPAREANNSVTVQTMIGTSDPVSCLDILSAAVFDSITIPSNGVGSILGPTSHPIIVFTPSISIPSGGHVVLEIPNGYFTGVVTVLTGGVAGLKATASMSSTSITITFDVAATGVGKAISLTLMGLTLSATSVPQGMFELYTSVEPGRRQKIAPAILNAPTFHSLYYNNATLKSGDSVAPVIVFSAVDFHAIGSRITLRMPPGYFLGTAILSTSVMALQVTATAAVSTSTEIIITTSGSAIESAVVVTMTLSGLSLGAAQPSGIYRLSTSVRPGFQQLLAPSIQANGVRTDPNAKYSAASTVDAQELYMLPFVLFSVLF